MVTNNNLVIKKEDALVSFPDGDTEKYDVSLLEEVFKKLDGDVALEDVAIIIARIRREAKTFGSDKKREFCTISREAIVEGLPELIKVYGTEEVLETVENLRPYEVRKILESTNSVAKYREYCGNI